MRWALLLFSVAVAAPLLGWLPVRIPPQADWQPVVDGVDYREFVYPLPNRAFVARMDRSRPELILDTALAGGSTVTGKETVSSMAARYDQSLNAWGGAWGPRNRVIVATNGSGYNLQSGFPQGGQLQAGSYFLRYRQHTGGTGFVWTLDREAFVGGCLAGGFPQQTVRHIPTGDTEAVDVMNAFRDGPGLWLYTSHFGSHTPEGSARLLVRVELDRPFSAASPPGMVMGTVRELADGDFPMSIYFDHVVLSADGRPAESFLGQFRPGDQVGFSADLRDLNINCRGSSGNEWTRAYASLDGGFVFLRDGRIRETEDVGGNSRDPRTAICLNEDYVYFVVVDGRQDSWSVGMTFSELGDFCRDELDATEGVNQDGGGSSALWVDGRLRNRPSDGQERAVANGWMMIELEPTLRSGMFDPGDEVWAPADSTVRQGPGTEYPILGEVSERTLLEIADPLADTQGLFAKGEYWWRVRFNEDEGWLAESALLGEGQLPELRRILEDQQR